VQELKHTPEIAYATIPLQTRHKYTTLLHAVANNALTPTEDMYIIRDIAERKTVIYWYLSTLFVDA
jgi:NADH dehydrogenase FAD-containing subunit